MDSFVFGGLRWRANRLVLDVKATSQAEFIRGVIDHLKISGRMGIYRQESAADTAGKHYAVIAGNHQRQDRPARFRARRGHFQESRLSGTICGAPWLFG